MKHVISWPFLLLFAIGWLVGFAVLIVAMLWTALADGYAAGRRRTV